MRNPIRHKIEAAILRILGKLQWFIVRLMQKVAALPPTAAQDSSIPFYVTRDPRITPAILEAAERGRELFLAQEPIKCQAELNALLELARGEYTRKLLVFMAQLTNTHEAEEVFTRMVANQLYTGMWIQSELNKQPTEAPEWTSI